MEEIIPLKKDIIFKTKIGEITNINVEHDYKIQDELVNGNVIISGTYKMTEASISEEDFYYEIPFGVAISSRINKDTLKIDIDDFKYEINKDTLKVNVELLLTCDERESVENYMNNYFNEEKELEIDNSENNLIEEIENNDSIENKIIINEKNISNNITNITNNILNNDEKYFTYKAYIVRKGDTIESICNKYNISMNELSEYNNISNINAGDKLIIPISNE